MTQRFDEPGSVFDARILVVEDERIIAKDIEQTLAALGYTVCGVVDTGQEAVRRAIEDRPDLVLMDIRIRGQMDGIQAAERIRETVSVPVVFLTAFADEPTLRRASGAGPYGYVLKPFDDRDLQAAIMMALVKHRAFQEMDQRVQERTDQLLRSEARFRQMSAVAELGLFALRTHELQAVLERAARTVCETLGTELSSVLELTPGETAFVLRAKHGWPEGFLKDAPLPAGRGSQSGYTLLSSGPVVSEDYASETRFQIPPQHFQESIAGGMTVVIHSLGDSRPFGILGTHTRSRRAFTASEIAFLQAVANLIATTIARARADERRIGAERRAEVERVHASRAEEALRIRDEFLAIASHELKTPLTTLHLEIQSLARRAVELDQEITSKLGRATRSMERLGNLVEQLLDVSRLSTGRMELRRATVTLEEVVADVADRLSGEARRSGCELQIVQEDHHLRGWWDRTRIEQVISNLVGNATKYGGPGPIEIRIARAGEMAELRVKDRGPGVAPQDVERIFQRFERAASLRHYGGLGLGLYLSRQIVEAHGGTIHVESHAGQGATFVVRLHLERVPAELPEQVAPH